MGTISVSIASVAVNVVEGSFELDDTVSAVSTIMFKVRDDSGSNHYTKGQPISITDSVSGNQYTGFVTAAVEDRVSPNTLIFTDIGGRDNHYLAEKRTYDGPELANLPAGIILCQLLNTLSAEGITANYAARRDTTATDFNAGTLTSVVGTSNVGDGDLELSLAGTPVSIIESTTANFGTGTLNGVTAANNSLAPTATQAIKLVATCSQPGTVNGYTYVKIWTGSHVIAANENFSYDVFILPSSPSGQMGVDFIMTDGTTFRDHQPTPDIQYVTQHPNQDVTPMSIGQWYHRSFGIGGANYAGKTIQSVMVVSEGDAVGTYTGYFKNIQLNTSFFAFTQNVTQQMQNNGYSSAVVSLVNTYDLSGAYRNSPAYSIDAAKILQSSNVTWTTVEPAGTKFVLKYSYDNVVFQTCTKNAPLPNLPPGANIAGKSLYFSEQFIPDPAVTGTNRAGPELTPVLSVLQITLNPSYSATKTDIVYEIAGNADWAPGTFTTSTNNAGTDLSLIGAIRNWNDGNASSQTIFTTNGQSSPDRQFFHLNIGNNTDARSRLDFAGQMADGTLEVDILVDNANGNMGCVYRTTFWGNADNTYAYVVQVNTTQIILSKGSNNATPSYTAISTVALNVSSGNWHRLKCVFVGSNHKVYLDDVLYINATDATYLAAGYVGLRCHNGTGSAYTAFFDNFGVLGSGASLTGNWVGPNQSLTAAGTYGSSVISWRDVSSDPGNTDTLLVESQVDGSTWQACANGQPIPNLTAGSSLSGINLKLRITLTTTTAATMPSIDNILVYINSQLNASGNRISPTLSLASISQLGGSIIAWNAVLLTGCTLGVDTRIDSGAWTDQSAQNGLAVAGITAQGAVLLDMFSVNSSANYTNTHGNGGGNPVWTYDTVHSKLTAVGGGHGIFLYNALTGIGDVDIQVDLSQSDGGGCIWHYASANSYYWITVDDASSSSTQNVITLIKMVAGTPTQLAQGAIAFVRGTYKRARVTMVGSVITVYLDGVQILTYTDGSPLAAGQVGIGNDFGTAVFYQFRVLPLGQNVSSHTLQTRLRLASTNPLATPQVNDVSLAAFGNTIQAGATIPQTSMYHKYMDLCIGDLANASDYWFNLDKNRVAYFLPQNALPSPWIASDGGNPVSGLAQGDFMDANITVEDASDLYRNREIVDNVLAPVTINETKLGDGVSKSWTFGNQWAGPPVITITNTVTGVVSVASVGILNVDTGKQFYYAVGSNNITEDASGALYDVTFSINFTGSGQFLTFSIYNDVAGQTARAAVEGIGTGIVTHVTDGTGLTKAQGDTLAQALVVQYGQIGRLLKATTRRSGLAVGQALTVFLTAHNINNTLFLIRNIKMKLTTEGPTGSMVQQPWYTIEAQSGADIGDWTKLYKRPRVKPPL